MMDYQELRQIVEPILGHSISGEQEDIIRTRDGPLWIIAGPGSGKSEVLVLRTLKLIFVDNVNPKSIIITTFTEKAARNLFDRISNYTYYIFQIRPELNGVIDIHSLRIGTLHSLCNDIMLEYRYPNYENYRLLDDIEQKLFVREHSSFVKEDDLRRLPLCVEFPYLFKGWDEITNSSDWPDRTRLPNRWRRARAAVKMFNRIVEDRIDINSLNDSGGIWSLLAGIYQDYVQSLESHRRCDFAHLQKKFLQFLEESPLGVQFLNGDGTEMHLGISHVMVDEYQDTNPIQEAIYFSLTRNTHNLCVVGDDDQALYRFRGGTVDCMVNFDRKCEQEWDLSFDHARWQRFLSNNYRSHKGIVSYYDRYINSFNIMRQDGARVDGKPTLSAEGVIGGDYPSVAYISGRTIEVTANNFALFIRGLLDNNIIENPNQCALLMRSVKETPHNAKHFADALRSIGITPYNPRSKTFLNNIEISGLLGTFISIIDPGLKALGTIPGTGIREIVQTWLQNYIALASQSPGLERYVQASINEIGTKEKNTWLEGTILDIFYHIISCEPFSEWKNDPERSYRLGKLSKLFEAYTSIPYPSTPGSNRGKLRISSSQAGEISFRWRQNFYNSFIGLLVSEGINDPEDDETISPPDRLPIMTVHQAKGLEFDFVFVYGLNRSPSPEDSILLEEALSQFRNYPSATRFNADQRAEQDLVRFYFVAYSRPKYTLIHLVPRTHLRNNNGNMGFLNKSVESFRDVVKDITR